MAIKPVEMKKISYYCDECNTKYDNLVDECSWCIVIYPYELVKKKLDTFIKDIDPNYEVSYIVSNNEIEIENKDFLWSINYDNFKDKEYMKEYINYTIDDFNNYKKRIEIKVNLLKTIYENFYEEKFDETIKEVEK